jgi:tetratricopeptide (TPR) repeat protein
MLITGCGRGADSTEGQAKVAERLNRADSYRRQGQYRSAILEIRNALKQNPADRTALVELANIYNELGMGKAAIKVMEPAIKDANRNEALVIAQAYYLQHKYQSALDYLEANTARLNLSADDATNLTKGRAQLRLGNLDAAQPILEKLSSSNLTAAIELNRLLRVRGNTAADTQLTALLQQHPENVELLSEAALQAEQQGQLSQAEDLLSKALIALPETDILLPQKAEVLQRLVSTLTKLGRSNEALVYAKSLSDANPSGAELQEKFKQAVELFQSGKLDEAEALLSEIYKESQNEAAGALIGMIRYAKKDMAGAAEYLSTNVDPEVSSEVVMGALATTQLQLAQPEKLLKIFDKNARTRIKTPELKTLVGIALLQTGATAEGEKLIQEALQEKPDGVALRVTLGRYYLMARQPDKAIAILEAGLKNRPDDNLSRLLIAAYIHSNKPEQALATARQYADTKPAKVENWWVLGRTALLLRKIDIAEAALNSALKVRADFLPAQLDLGQIYLLQHQPAKAEAIFQTAQKQQPESIDALIGLVASLHQKGVQNGALETQLLAISSTTNARAVLADYYLRLNLLGDAERLLSSISSGETNNYLLQLKQSLALQNALNALNAREPEKARTFIVEGLKLEPNNPALLVLLARTELQAGKTAEAKKVSTQFTEAQAKNPQVQELLGDIALLENNNAAEGHYRSAWASTANEGIAMKLHQSLGKNPGAADAFVTEWKQRLPQSATPWRLQGMQKQQAGDTQGAIAAYETAVSRNPTDAQALNNLAWLYLEQGDKRALATAEKASVQQPQNPAILDTYGWALVKTGRTQEGIKHLQQAHSLAPDSKEIEEHLRSAMK